MIPDSNKSPDKSKEWKLIERLLSRSFDEQRRARRWGIFFKSLTFLYLFALLFMLRAGTEASLPNMQERHAALIDINGMIAPESAANADAIVQGLKKAFEAEQAEGIILRINSPGGSPVQSDMVYDEILRLKQLHSDKKVYAAITDIGASGGYYIAAAADAIYASDASLVGSIGVVSGNFGFVEAMEKLGIERRIFTSGKSKALLDPFLEQNPAEVAHFNTMLLDVHQQFIDSVLEGRGDRIDLTQREALFSGRLWTGRQALSLGLVDEIHSPGQVAKQVIGVEKIVDYTTRPDPFDEVFRRIGVAISTTLKSWVFNPVSL